MPELSECANSEAARHMLICHDGLAYAAFPIPGANDNLKLHAIANDDA